MKLLLKGMIKLFSYKRRLSLLITFTEKITKRWTSQKGKLFQKEGLKNKKRQMVEKLISMLVGQNND